MENSNTPNPNPTVFDNGEISKPQTQVLLNSMWDYLIVIIFGHEDIDNVCENSISALFLPSTPFLIKYT